ncbi:MAG: 50S ribosomal protein L15 [Elusimicrobiota bacterium]|nr:50S ribosomal protein L15 [Elusimicrobiota bacterium]MDH5661598.1 50S ribosomal protein L15 [Elusimicrobiota bacterium]
MKLSELTPNIGSKHKKKRVGRGPGSGHGGTSCRGTKGQRSRSGGGVRLGFEGGQMPLIRRLPKRGFTRIFKKEYNIVNLRSLEEKFSDNEEVTASTLKEKGLVKKGLPIKILGSGEITKKLMVKVAGFSKSAREKILKAGGSVEILEK